MNLDIMNRIEDLVIVFIRKMPSASGVAGGSAPCSGVSKGDIFSFGGGRG